MTWRAPPRILRALALVLLTAATTLLLLQSHRGIAPVQVSEGALWSATGVRASATARGGIPRQVQHAQATPRVCLLGNAESVATAERSHRMWGQAFPSYWYIWNQVVPSTSPSQLNTHPAQLHVVASSLKARALTFADGIQLNYQAAKEHDDCDYYFVHDDDLEFTVAAGFSQTKQPIHAVLLQWLQRWQPLVAGFPWDVGRARYSELSAIAHARASTDGSASPLVLFDNGMVLYHTSVADFFIPFAPAGEGGFVGKWTLGAQFLHLFVPWWLRERAATCEQLRYRNLINLDNLNRTERARGRKETDTLVFYGAVRHPYEYKLNEKYRNFLKSGLRDSALRFGPETRVADVTWRPASGTPSNASATTSQLIQRLVQLYHWRHPALSNNAWVRAHANELQRQSAQALPKMRLDLHIFVHERVTAFQTLWTSVQALLRPSAHMEIGIVVHHDPSPKPQIRAELSKALHALVHPFAPIKVVEHSRPLGLKASILKLATADARFIWLLEDDLEVSPLALRFAEICIWRYLQNGPSQLLGLSLYAQLYNEVTDSYLPGASKTGYAATLTGLRRWRMPQSWGGIYRADAWNAFTRWLAQQPASARFLLPQSLTNRWPEAYSWKKPLLYFMAERGLELLYPVLPHRWSLTTNTLVAGTNDQVRAHSSKWLPKVERFKLSLLSSNDTQQLAPGWQELATSDGAWTKMINGSRDYAWQRVLAAFPSLSTLDVLDAHGHVLGTDAQDAARRATEQKALSAQQCVSVLIYLRHDQAPATIALVKKLSQTPIDLDLIVVSPDAAAAHALQTATTREKWASHLTVLHDPAVSAMSYMWSRTARQAVRCQALWLQDSAWPVTTESFVYAVETFRGHYYDHVVGLQAAARNHQGQGVGMGFLRKNTEHASWFLPTNLVIPSALTGRIAIQGATPVADQCRWLVLHAELASRQFCPVMIWQWTRPEILPVEHDDVQLAAWLTGCIEHLCGLGVAPNDLMLLRTSQSVRMEARYGTTTRYINREWLKCAPRSPAIGDGSSFLHDLGVA
ncbi:uncharacterized protein MONBRDRAFT_4940 [Monosiga brevicollis MX1]|uniref:Glycosyltransferase 2-like domain-containing protein n=1 Tax=Monosiga brevicollis TaxID=81824 RepID=A9UPE7_MONBE|nr:uncharacterized protein MONBRDRAFT_4940 [Monosiga brevicollis MX1]EDQ92407.1 predicted protein [Monosiga brevicollis MX1]|eukprot:XP_001742169.1 hypothetical protein [Monosiga brevicollis MX1]